MTFTEEQTKYLQETVYVMRKREKAIQDAIQLVCPDLHARIMVKAMDIILDSATLESDAYIDPA